MSVTIETNVDVMIASDTARRAAALLDFAPIFQARLAGAVITLSELVLKTQMMHEITINGIRDDNRVGIQASCAVQWLANVDDKLVIHALDSRIKGLVDRTECTRQGETPVIRLTLWRPPSRKPGER
jgi:hypothetical protein